MPYDSYDTNTIEIGNIDWKTDPEYPGEQYVGVEVHDPDLDMNSIELYITADTPYGTFKQNVLLDGDDPKNIVNFGFRTNCENQDDPLYTYDLENNDNIKILTDIYQDTDFYKNYEFRFYLDPFYTQYLDEQNLQIEADVYDINGNVYPKYKKITYTCIDCGGSGQPDPPTNVTAVPADSNMSVKLTWNAASGTDFYKVYRRPTSEPQSSNQPIGITTETQFFDTHQTIPGTNYTYAIASVNSHMDDGEGANSSEVTATMPSGGTVTSNRTWFGASLNNMVTVTDSTILKIEQGSDIKMAGNVTLKVQPGSKIKAEGISGNPIYFDRLNAGSSWNSLYLKSDNNSFRWCQFEGGAIRPWRLPAPAPPLPTVFSATAGGASARGKPRAATTAVSPWIPAW